MQRENDPLAAFLQACCRIHAGASATTTALWNEYQAWADAEGLSEKERLTRLTLIGRLKRRGFRLYRLGPGSCLRGIALLNEPQPR